MDVVFKVDVYFHIEIFNIDKVIQAKAKMVIQIMEGIDKVHTLRPVPVKSFIPILCICV